MATEELDRRPSGIKMIYHYMKAICIPLTYSRMAWIYNPFPMWSFSCQKFQGKWLTQLRLRCHGMCPVTKCLFSEKAEIFSVFLSWILWFLGSVFLFPEFYFYPLWGSIVGALLSPVGYQELALGSRKPKFQIVLAWPSLF